MKHPYVSVIVLAHNGKRYLENCLNSIAEQTYPDYEVILVDNASTDDSVEFVRKNFVQVRIVRNSENLGYANANNLGALKARGEYILFLNVDTWVNPDLLYELVKAASVDSRIAVCACTQVSYDGKCLLNRGITADIFGYPASPEGSHVLYADGASLFISSDVFRELHGFDGSYFLYGEDLDLCWRVLLLGYEVVHVDSARVFHHTAGTAIILGQAYDIKKERRYLFERNSIRTLSKNYSLRTLAYVLPVKLMIVASQVIVCLSSRREDLAASLIQALMWNMKHIRGTLIEREIVQRQRRVSDRIIMDRMKKELAIVRSYVMIRQGRC
jgi:GT2 family glycosyltransferase